MGIDPDRMVPGDLQRQHPEDYQLWPEHAMAWSVYLGCSTQWRRTATPWGQWHWDGLDYAGVEIVMRRYAVPAAQRGEVFAQLQVLEAQALRQLNRG